MEIGFDPNKSKKNRRECKLPFELAADLEWDRAVTFEDGETRMIALCPTEGAAARRLLQPARQGAVNHQLRESQRTRGKSL
jgi:uncharacterized DUF497 family protein